ncbi:MAG: chemotaxis protein CheB [Myxococcota bacterium]|nr:chemotaxis protein CheB [Deltaproteobacteria bacterium]MDQ3334811.1 chemotaxis protein CheB [Myxococcota bacterium]
MRTRDVVVIGCSAGGVDALPRIIQQLPADFPASVFIVQHIAATKTPYLVDILSRNAQVPVTWGEQGERFVQGHVYVAPPDAHMIFSEDDHIALTRGAREKHSRPSIDKLFRSAAATHAGRVIGVLLTGMLDDGVAGLCAIRDAGGRVVVQDPQDAAFPDLPANALLSLVPDRILGIDAIAAALAVLVQEPMAMSPLPEAIVLEAALDRMVTSTPQQMSKLGPQSALSCPDCAGPTWQLGGESDRRYRCYLGHVSTARELLARGEVAVEAALWSAVRALNERAMTLETLARDCEGIGNAQVAKDYHDRAEATRKQAELARHFMLDLMQHH